MPNALGLIGSGSLSQARQPGGIWQDMEIHEDTFRLWNLSAKCSLLLTKSAEGHSGTEPPLSTSLRVIPDLNALTKVHRIGNEYHVVPRFAQTHLGFECVLALCYAPGSPFDFSRDRMDLAPYRKEFAYRSEMTKGMLRYFFPASKSAYKPGNGVSLTETGLPIYSLSPDAILLNNLFGAAVFTLHKDHSGFMNTGVFSQHNYRSVLEPLRRQIAFSRSNEHQNMCELPTYRGNGWNKFFAAKHKTFFFLCLDFDFRPLFQKTEDADAFKQYLIESFIGGLYYRSAQTQELVFEPLEPMVTTPSAPRPLTRDGD